MNPMVQGLLTILIGVGGSLGNAWGVAADRVNLAGAMLDSGRGISDLVFSPGRPPQVEKQGHLTAVAIPQLPLLKPQAPDLGILVARRKRAKQTKPGEQQFARQGVGTAAAGDEHRLPGAPQTRADGGSQHRHRTRRTDHDCSPARSGHSTRSTPSDAASRPSSSSSEGSSMR